MSESQPISEQPSPPSRKRRFTAEQAYDALISAGQELVAEHGASIGVSGVTLNQAIARSGVPRPSAYRIFSQGEADPQQAFRSALLLSWVDGGSWTDMTATTDVVFPLLEGNKAIFDEGDPGKLATLLREVVRVGSAAFAAHSVESLKVSVYSTALASGMPCNAHDERLHEALVEAEARNVGYRSLYEAMYPEFGLRLRPGWDWDMFTLMFSTASVGTALRHHVNPNVREVMRPTGPDGTYQPWTMLGMMLESFILTTIEADPDAPHSARINDWLT